MAGHAGRKTEGFDHRFVHDAASGLERYRSDAFAISHDAARPSATACVTAMLKSLWRRLGFISPDVAAAAARADILVLEANHDEEMVETARTLCAPAANLRALGTFIQQDGGVLLGVASGQASCGSSWLIAVRRTIHHHSRFIRCARSSLSTAVSSVKIFAAGLPGRQRPLSGKE